MKPSPRINALLLAAGYSRRFGSNKLLHCLSDGRTMIEHSVHTLLEADLDITAIVKEEDTQIQNLLRVNGVSFIFPQTSHAGIGDNIATIVNVAHENATACIIALADMPFVKVTTIRKIATQLREGAPIVAPYYQGKRGNPVGFNQRWFPQLRSLTGDQGARQLLTQSSEITTYECDDEGILWDIDTIEDIDAEKKRK